MAKQFNQNERRAYNEAFDIFEAFLNGAPMEENPWKNGSRRHAAWAEGMREAREMHAKERCVQSDLEQRRAEREC